MPVSSRTPMRSPSWSARDFWTAVALFAGTILSRLPFRSQILYHWDSVNFAFGMREFDIANESPHAPGYIGYVWLCRLVDMAFHDPQKTMIWLSIVSSGLAAVAMYLLGRAMYERRTGLVAALLMSSSPLFWFYGEIALPHTLDAFLAILSVWLLYETLLGRSWALVAAAASLAVAGAVRQQTPVFLGLLALYAGARFLRRVEGEHRWHCAALAVAVFGLSCAGWFFPLIRSVGGLARYVEILTAFSERFDTTTSVFLGAGVSGLTRNLRKLGMYTLYGWSTAILPFLAYGWVRLASRRLTTARERVLYVSLWVAPSVLFYTLIHMGQQGLVFIFLPALLLLSARAIVKLLEGQTRAVLIAAVSAVVAANGALFIGLPEYPLGGERFKVLSWDTLHKNDAYYCQRVDAIRGHFPPEGTAIVAARWRHVAWYLPEYVHLPFAVVAKWEEGAGEPLIGGVAEGQFSAANLGLTDGMAVVLFDAELEPFNRATDRSRELALGDGETLTYLELMLNEDLRIGVDGIGVVP